MDENRLSGAAKKIGGKVYVTIIENGKPVNKSGLDVLFARRPDLGDIRLDCANTSAEDTMRDFIENRPYTTAAIALGLGWLIGRSHRPF